MNKQSTKEAAEYMNSLPLAEALWWYIENIADEDPRRTDLFFYLRERVRGLKPPQPAWEVKEK